MTTNERLAKAGLLESFGKAEAAKNRAEMIRLLTRVGYNKAAAVVMVDLHIGKGQREKRDPNPA